MEIFIEWDGIHYPHLCTDYFVNKKAEKKIRNNNKSC